MYNPLKPHIAKRVVGNGSTVFFVRKYHLMLGFEFYCDRADNYYPLFQYGTHYSDLDEAKNGLRQALSLQTVNESLKTLKRRTLPETGCRKRKTYEQSPQTELWYL